MLETVCAYWREVDSSLAVMLKNPANSAVYFAAEHRAAVYDTAAMEIHQHIYSNLPAWMFEEYVQTVHEVLGQPAMLCGRTGVPYEV